jgi:DNA-binding CsgD family transcriptional regulator
MASNSLTLNSETQVLALGRALDAVLASSGPTDLCRQIVHAGFADGMTRGCALYFLDNKSTLKMIASYGQVLEDSSGLSAWDASPLSEAIREKAARLGTADIEGESRSLLAIPFMANGAPIGLVSLVIESPDFRVQFPDEFANLISKLGAFYLDSLDFGNISNGKSLSHINPEDLTTRQLNILGHIETGLVNMEIAKILMLSESTIRQETVKIYRALGVGNRQEAVKKAKALGMLPKRVSLPD